MHDILGSYNLIMAKNQTSQVTALITQTHDTLGYNTIPYNTIFHTSQQWQGKAPFKISDKTSVRLQKLPWYKTGLVSRQVLHLLSKLQNWICPKTGQYKTCIVSNTKIEASIRATKPKPWQSQLTSETVEIFIQNKKAGLVPMQSRFWCGRLSVGTKPVLVQQV